jgi:hypothetical protein
MLSAAARPTLFHPPVISSPVRGAAEEPASSYWQSPLRMERRHSDPAVDDEVLETKPCADPQLPDHDVAAVWPQYDDATAEEEEDEPEDVEPCSLLRSSCSSLSSTTAPLERNRDHVGDGPTQDDGATNSIRWPEGGGDTGASFPGETPCSPSCFGTAVPPQPPMYYARMEEDDDHRPAARHDAFFGSGSSQEEGEDDDTAVFATMTEDITQPSQGPALPPPPSPQQQQQHHWWRQLFQQLEHQHSQERTQWQSELQQSAQQQSLLKSELKQTLQQQLAWLEERCLAPQHVLPGVHQRPDQWTPETTMESQSSSAGSLVAADCTTRGALIQGGGGDDMATSCGGGGVEMTYDTSLQVQQIQALEQCVREERLRHETDRAEWIRLLEAAAADTTKAAQQLRTLQLKSTKQQVQAKQWKEKARVLAELLPLTEQQFQTERWAWQQERAAAELAGQQELERVREELVQEHEQVLQQVKGEMEGRLAVLQEQSQQEQAKLVQKVREEAVVQQQLLEDAMAEMQRGLEQQNEASKLALQEQQAERERLEAHVQSLLDERRTLRADAADFTELATRSKQQCTVLQKHLAEAESSDHQRKDEDWESALDRALAERDLYRQEADALRQELDERRLLHDASPVSADLAQKYKESVEQHSQVVQRLKRMEEQRAAERGTWKCHLEAALAATRDAQAVHEQERAAWSERTAIELQGLQRRWQQSVVDRKRQFEEIIALCSASESGTITEAHVVQHLQQRVQAVEEEMEQRCQVLVTNHFTEIKDYKQQIAVLNETVRHLEQEMEERCARLMEQHHAELSELHERLEEVEQESSETIAAGAWSNDRR